MKLEQAINLAMPTDTQPGVAATVHRNVTDRANERSEFTSSNVSQTATAERQKPSPLPRFRTILVPVDGSPFAEHALPVALGIAERSGAAIRLIHVHTPLESTFQPAEPYRLGLDAWLKQRQQRYMDDLARMLVKISTVPITPVCTEGRTVVDTLWDAASGADLVVMATHGRGPLGRLILGSVADSLMRRLPVPLLVVRGQDAPVDLTSEPAFRHVVIALDGSKESENILQPAMALGSLSGAEHTLLHVAPGESFLPFVSPALRSTYSIANEAEAGNYLQQTAKRWETAAERIHSQVLPNEGSIAKAILDYAQSHDADLIALSSREQGTLSRVFDGSVAEWVVRHATVPVLVCQQEVTEDGQWS